MSHDVVIAALNGMKVTAEALARDVLILMDVYPADELGAALHRSVSVQNFKDAKAAYERSLRPKDPGEFESERWVQCRACGGRGYTDKSFWSKPCIKCRRVGFVQRTEEESI